MTHSGRPAVCFCPCLSIERRRLGSTWPGIVAAGLPDFIHRDSPTGSTMTNPLSSIWTAVSVNADAEDANCSFHLWPASPKWPTEIGDALFSTQKEFPSIVGCLRNAARIRALAALLGGSKKDVSDWLWVGSRRRPLVLAGSSTWSVSQLFTIASSSSIPQCTPLDDIRWSNPSVPGTY